MLGLLIAAAVAGYDAPECRVAFEREAPASAAAPAALLRLRPACPLSRASTAAAVAALLALAEDDRITLALGRLERYPWLSELLARQASSSRRWNLAEGRPAEGGDNAYVAAALRGMPEFTALFGRWRIEGVSTEKVLKKRAAELRLPAGAPVPPDAGLPYDAIVWVRLARP